MSLYAFEKLEQFLDKKGYSESKPGEFKVVRRELLIGMQQGEIIIRKDGIFCMIDGIEHRGYIFNQKPDIGRYKVPKFHITDCETIENRGRLTGDYIWTNSEQVQLYDRGNKGLPYPSPNQLTTLLLCSKCRDLVNQQFNNLNTTSDFHQYLKDQYDIMDEQEPIKTDIYGYTLDFSNISRRYRELKGYKCERCKIDLSQKNAQRYLHVHHRNGRKTDNRVENLECLCIRCHAAVDKRHQGNFGKPINLRELQTFNERFPE